METRHLPVGTTLQGGKYRIVRFLSSGGFGCTYEAEHTQFQSRVALKEFFVSDFCNRNADTGEVSLSTQSKAELLAKLRKKFLEEAKAVFQMHHNHIIRVIDIFEENGTAYYVMDLIDGQSLADVVKCRGKLPEKEAVKYVLQIAGALKYVHSLNRLHLDVKPGNIMVDSNGNAILIDFGASKHYDDESGENTSTLMGVNTHGYAPVEQMNASFTHFSPATDIYSLGATLYKLLTGTTPPSSISLVSDLETLQPLPSSFSRSVREAVNAAMRLKMKERPQTVDEFLYLLKNAPTIPTSNATVLDAQLIQPISPKEKKEVVTEPSTTSKTNIERKFSITKYIWVLFIVFVGIILLWEVFAHSVRSDINDDSLLCDTIEECDTAAVVEVDILETHESKLTGYINGHEWVDLGLSVKWATCNVGASSPSDHGDYYAWGETEPKSQYRESNSITYGEKMDNIAGKSQYDAARANWGGSWRLPTEKEIDELVGKCVWVWTTQGGHHGYLVTGPNGNSIFLPAAGWCSWDEVGGEDEVGGCWGDAPTRDVPDGACSLSFDRGDIGRYVEDRFIGQPVRPVTK